MARPTEVKAVAAAISEPAQDATEAAKRAIAALDESRQDRTDYLVVRQAGRLAQAFGPYATYNAAAKAITGSKIPMLDGSKVFVIPLYHPTAADRALEKASQGGFSDEAKAIWEIARNGGCSPARKGRRAVALKPNAFPPKGT